jgi:hypothetical protein
MQADAAQVTASQPNSWQRARCVQRRRIPKGSSVPDQSGVQRAHRRGVVIDKAPEDVYGRRGEVPRLAANRDQLWSALRRDVREQPRERLVNV